VAWQWAHLEPVLDLWLDGLPDAETRRRVLEAMAEMAEHPDNINDGGMANQSPLVRQLVVPETDVLLVYLRAEQYHVLRLITISEI
jgi:hypothetical protein